MNLLGNSMKFTEKGKVELNVKQVKVEGNLSTVCITVSDTGIGISNDKIKSIFESFKQADRTTSRKFGGTGLGLSIVKNLVELMGGTIEVKSEIGKGSTFICNIPFEIKYLNNKSSYKLNDMEKKEEKKVLNLKILVAEDNSINRKIINRYLNNLSCVFDFAENGVKAVESFKTNTYDVILMDVQMPEMDGLAATRIIREKEKEIGGHIPIIALTAGVMKEEIDMCIEAGMDEHISKPVNMEKIYRTLKVFKS